MTVLGLVEDVGAEVDRLSLEMLTLGRTVAERVGSPLHAAVFGGGAASLAPGLAAYGVSNMHLITHERLDAYAPEARGESLVQLIGAVGPQIVMAPGSDRGHEVMAHAAARLGLPLVANCTDVVPGDPFHVSRLRWGGSLIEEARLHGGTKLLTVAPHSVEPKEVPYSGDPVVEEMYPTLDDAVFRVRLTGREEAVMGKVALADARVVVGGGRGVGSVEGFAALEELAGLLGGAVGVSRAVTSLGWRPHSDQIGQTGARIAPDLYIACGISGAIQHMVGCKAAKRILAINTDPEAPIMSRADYVVVGDLHAVVSALITEIRNTRDVT